MRVFDSPNCLTSGCAVAKALSDSEPCTLSLVLRDGLMKLPEWPKDFGVKQD